MHVGNGLQDLLENGLGFGLRDSAVAQLNLLFDQVVKTLAFAQLHDEVDVHAAVNHLVKSDDALMLQYSKNIDLLLEALRCKPFK